MGVKKAEQSTVALFRLIFLCVGNAYFITGRAEAGVATAGLAAAGVATAGLAAGAFCTAAGVLASAFFAGFLSLVAHPVSHFVPHDLVLHGLVSHDLVAHAFSVLQQLIQPGKISARLNAASDNAFFTMRSPNKG